MYLASWAVHFAALPDSGTGDAFLSPHFQATLRGTAMHDAATAAGGGAVRDGDTVALRMMYNEQCYLIRIRLGTRPGPTQARTVSPPGSSR